MVPLIVIVSVVIFFLVDLVLRTSLKSIEQKRVAKKREEALDAGLKLDFADEATSLTRVEVEHPKARILAVDDEQVVLDSFRKILVLAGYSIDTVQSGPEALSLVRNTEYDFVFTDLKMPGMDGLDVTKAVKHLRPDIDVMMITGFATIDTAVDAMKFGATDHVEKPFTEDELVAFVDNALIKRQDRLEKEKPPEVRLASDSETQDSSHAITVPGGFFVSNEHVWVSIEQSGEVRVGLDEFAHRVLGLAADAEMPAPNQAIHRGDGLFQLVRGDKTLTFTSPVSGKVTGVNVDLPENLDLAALKPFETGWVCTIRPSKLSSEISSLRIGVDALGWYTDQIKAMRAKTGEAIGQGDEVSEDAWSVFEELCL